jgi:hypothetical protein
LRRALLRLAEADGAKKKKKKRIATIVVGNNSNKVDGNEEDEEAAAATAAESELKAQELVKYLKEEKNCDCVIDPVDAKRILLTL